MNDVETIKLGMYETVISFLSENKDITSSVRGFTWSISKLRRIIDEIRGKEKEASSLTLEKTIHSSGCREDLVFQLVDVAGAIHTYAKDINDLSLRQKSRYTQSILIRLKDKELIDKASGLLLIAENLLSELNKFGLSKDVLIQLEQKINAFKYALENKISSFISGTALSSCEELFMDADRILAKNIDSYVELLSEEYTEFYDDYLIARSLETQDQKRILMELEDEE